MDDQEPQIRGKYLSLTTYRRDGTGVATPVWFVAEKGRLLVTTEAGSYKVRRIRRNPSVTIAPCTATGRLLGEPITARAEVLPEDDGKHVEELMARKYRLDRLLVMPVYRAVQWARGKSTGGGAATYLAITPS